MLRLTLLGTLSVLLVIARAGAPSAEETEKSYSISLEKTAEVDKQLRQIEDKKVLTEEHTIRKGEHLWQVLREKGLLEQKPSAVEELLRVLKKLNPSLRDLNLIHPGQHVIIPLKIVPLSAGAEAKPGEPLERLSPSDPGEVDLKMYTVKRGDNVTRIAKGLLNFSDRDLTREYLDMVRRMNPSIRDINIIYPGQIIRLPIFSPQVVRKPIEPLPHEAPGKIQTPVRDRPDVERTAQALARIFSEMGEEWIQTGEHFIPLKSGGQMDLKAAVFPILTLRSGRRVVVDLYGGLPERIPKLIESSWGNYKVVRLSGESDLKSALNKLIDACGYAEVRRDGKPLELGGDIPFRLSGQWIVRFPENAGYGERVAAVIRLRGDSEPGIPGDLKHYLEGRGTKVIDYPPADEEAAPAPARKEEMRSPADPPSLVREILEAAGRPFSSDVDIPVFQSRGAEFKLVVKADILLKIHERDAVIDLDGLSPDVVSLLKEHGFLVLALKDVRDPLEILARTLGFLGISFDAGPHRIGIPSPGGTAPLSFVVTGTVFPCPGAKMLATRLALPPEIASHLSRNGYRVLSVTFS